MKRLVCFAMILGMVFLSSCSPEKPEAEAMRFDYTKAAELARAEFVPVGGHVTSEESAADDEHVIVEIKFTYNGQKYKGTAVYEIDGYRLDSKEFVPIN